MVPAYVSLRGVHGDFYALRGSTFVEGPGHWILIWETKKNVFVSCMMQDGDGDWVEYWCHPA